MNTEELNFAYKVRHALDDNAAALAPAVTQRLAGARKAAVARKKKNGPLAVFLPKRALAGSNNGLFDAPVSWLGRMSVLVPLAVLVLGLVGIYQFEQERRISDTAEIDAAVLADELPLSAYLDHGFNAYLAERDN